MDKELLSQKIDDTTRRAHLPMQTLQKKIPLFNNSDLSFTDDKVCSLREPSEMRIKKELDFTIIAESHKKTAQLVENKHGPSSSIAIVSIYKHVNRLIQILKYRILYKDYHNLKKPHLEIIDDLGANDYFSQKKLKRRNAAAGIIISGGWNLRKKIEPFMRKLILNIMKKLKKCIRIIPTISHNNQIFIIWDILILFLTCYFIVVIPISICFGHYLHSDSEFLLFFELIGFTFYIIDIFLKFNRSYYENGNEITNKTKICLQYIKSGFILDVVSIIGLFYYTYEVNSFIQSFIIFKSYFFTEYLNFIEQRFVLNDFYEGIFKILRLTMKILYIAHILACFFNFIAFDGIQENNVRNSWLISEGLYDADWYERYVNSYYWSITTLATVGYGDITPQNTKEKIYCMMVMLLGGGIFAYNINKLSNIFNDITKDQREYKANLKLLNKMMKRKKISSELQNKVRNYFHFIYKKEKKKEIEEESSLFSKLSRTLQNEIILNIHAPILKQSQFFCNNFTEEFLQNIVFKMKSKLYSPEEIIFQEGEINPCIFFLTQGTVKLFYDSKNQGKKEAPIYTCSKGETFGEFNLLSNQEYKYTCKSNEFSSIYSISRKDLLDELEKFPDDKEKYMMIKDSINLYENYELIYKRCKLCGTPFHPTEKCHFIIFQAHKEKLFYIMNRDFKNSCVKDRKPFERKKKKKSYMLLEKRSYTEIDISYEINDNKFELETEKHSEKHDRINKSEENKLSFERYNKSEDNRMIRELNQIKDKDIFRTASSSCYRYDDPKINSTFIRENKDIGKRASFENIDKEKKTTFQLNSFPNNTTLCYIADFGQSKLDEVDPHTHITSRRNSINSMQTLFEYHHQNHNQTQNGSKTKNKLMELFDFNFETYHTYKLYFPKNNLHNVIGKLSSFFSIQKYVSLNSIKIKKNRSKLISSGQFLFKNNNNTLKNLTGTIK